MKNIQSILVLVLVLISGYARGQGCPTVNFSSTSSAWPTVNALPGIPQRLCLQQNIGSAGPNVTVFLSASSAPAGTVTWQPLSPTGITLSGQSNTQCTFSLNDAAAPFDYGKKRIVVRWGTTCGCVDTLDIFRVMNPQLNASSFAAIQGPTCLAPGTKGNYYVDPRFSRPANIALGIGVDGYNWSVLNDNSAGVGDWTQGATPGPTASLLASGDNSATEIMAPPTGWTNSTATIQVVQGNVCNTFNVPFTIQKGAPTATITASAINAAYTNSIGTASQVNGSGTTTLTACLNAGTGATPITLTAPTGNSYVWTLPVGGGFSLAPGSTLTSQAITVNATGNRSGVIQVTCTPLAGSCGIATTATFTITRRLTAADNIISSAAPTCLQPGATPPANFTFTISNFPPDAGTNFTVPVPSGTTGVSVGAINPVNGQFIVSVAAGATSSASFGFTAQPIGGYACAGNSATLGGFTVPGPGSTNYQLVTWEPTWPSTITGNFPAIRTIYWHDNGTISPANSTTIPSNVSWSSGFGGICTEADFTYEWRFTGWLNGTFRNNIPSSDPTLPTSIVANNPFTIPSPQQSASLRPGYTYGTVSNPSCTITCTITSSSACNGNLLSCFSLTRTKIFNGGGIVIVASPHIGGGHSSEKLNGVNNSQILVIPNPNKGSFKLEVPENFEGGTGIILDMNGKEVYRIKTLEKSHEIKLKKVTPGLYSIMYRNNDEFGQQTIKVD